ncbi:MAG: hypothetical protein H0U60_20040 [Blastocatellia bacterium]|nr:hypothetical protein [Blastocatellia bacterium]
MSDVKILTLLPTRGIVLTETISALHRELYSNTQSPSIITTHDLPLPASRNFLVETALKQTWWTHALLLDDDVILPEGWLKEALKLNADVALANYPMQGKVDGKNCGTIVHDKDKSVAFGGLGAVLVKRSVFETMGQPWFVLTQYKINRTDDGSLGFYTGQADGGANWSAGEDTYFFLQCRKHKLKVKETKLVATHARLDQLVTNSHNSRYTRQHIINKNDKIERELL